MFICLLTVRSAAGKCFRDINQELSHETSEATWCRGRTSHLFDLLPSLSPETSQLVLPSPFTAFSYDSISKFVFGNGSFVFRTIAIPRS